MRESSSSIGRAVLVRLALESGGRGCPVPPKQINVLGHLAAKVLPGGRLPLGNRGGFGPN
jgi:hypothetical protein